MVTAPAPRVGVEIENLAAFRREVARADRSLLGELRAGLKKAGEPPLKEAQREVPFRTGRLSRGYTIRISGSAASIVNKQPYAAGAEWGQFGKWSGFRRYGGPGRFAWKAVEDQAEQIEETLYEALRELIELGGFAR